ncbi:hypothetical protein LXL04_020303 [Taraxacum kok-saghyz]
MQKKKKDKKALFTIYQAVEDHIFERISNTKTSKEAWELLHKSYRDEEKVKTIKLQTLRCEFDSLRLKDSESIEEYYKRVITLLNQMQINGEPIEDKRVVEKILRSLTRKFVYIVVAIEESKDLAEVSLEGLLGTLQSHELRLRQFDDAPFEQAFQLQSSGQTSDQNKGNQGEYSDEKGRGKPLSQVQCYYCGKLGHIKKNYEKRLAKERNANFMQTEKNQEDWCNHMSRRRELFVSLEDTAKKEVKTADDKKLMIQGCGTVSIKTQKGDKEIKDVYFVSRLKHNMLSVGQLISKGFTLQFKTRVCEIKDSMTSTKMFPVCFQDEDFYVLKTTSESNSLLWRNRYGHLNFGSLIYMCRHIMHSREPFPHDKAWRATKPLELIYSDVCGPMRTNSIGDSRYVLTFIDVYGQFVIFKSLVENQHEQKIKCLRSDCGGDFNSIEFQNFLKEHGIHHQLTTRYIPQQNGIAERKNMTLLEMARSMLKSKNLSNSLWAEAVACAGYLSNRASTKALDNITSQEAWKGYKPRVNHLRTFGYLAYSHIPDQKRGKLDDQSEKVIFVGYSETFKAYKLFNPTTKKVMISRDVIFDEDKTWNGTKTETAERNKMRLRINNPQMLKHPQTWKVPKIPLKHNQQKLHLGSINPETPI